MQKTITLPQTQDSPITREEYPNFLFRYGYARSQDSLESAEAGQDFLSINVSDSNLAFSLCDGVSESFMGDIAARIVGETLLSWFTKLDTDAADSIRVKKELETLLNNITKAAQIRVNNYELPENVPAMLREVLAEKQKAGSESMFCAGIIDTDAQKSIFAWMGDIRLRIWDDSGEQTDYLLHGFDKKERWSTRLGLVGELHTLELPLNSIQRILVYTDGLSNADSNLDITVDDRTLTRYVTEAERRDDIALLDIFFELKEQPVYVPLPPPLVNLDIKKDELQIYWPEIAAATQYQVIVSWLLKTTTWSIPISSLSEQVNSVHIRAWDNELPGNWNKLDSAGINSAIQDSSLQDSLTQAPKQDVKVAIPDTRPAPKKKRLTILRLILITLVIFGIGFISGVLISNNINQTNELHEFSPQIPPTPRTSSPLPSITPDLFFTVTPNAYPAITETPSPSPAPLTLPSPTALPLSITDVPTPVITLSPSVTMTPSVSLPDSPLPIPITPTFFEYP